MLLACKQTYWRFFSAGMTMGMNESVILLDILPLHSLINVCNLVRCLSCGPMESLALSQHHSRRCSRFVRHVRFCATVARSRLSCVRETQLWKSSLSDSVLIPARMAKVSTARKRLGQYRGNRSPELEGWTTLRSQAPLRRSCRGAPSAEILHGQISVSFRRKLGTK